MGKVLLRLRFLVPWLRSSSLGTNPLNQKGQKRGISTVKMTGIYTRKPDVEFADLPTISKVKALLSNHPWSIANTATLMQEYANYFGVDELEVLKKSCTGSKFNMVSSPVQKWVLNGVWVPEPPKPEEVLQPGMEWQVWGTERRQVPIGSTTMHPATAIAEISADTQKQLAAIVFDAVTDALEAWSKK